VFEGGSFHHCHEEHHLSPGPHAALQGTHVREEKENACNFWQESEILGFVDTTSLLTKFSNRIHCVAEFRGCLQFWEVYF